MKENQTIYRVFSPVPRDGGRNIVLAPHIPDLSGKTVAALRHTFRADETFVMIEQLLKEKYPGIRFISNVDMPDARASTPQEEAELIAVLKEKGCDVVLAGNGA